MSVPELFSEINRHLKEMNEDFKICATGSAAAKVQIGEEREIYVEVELKATEDGWTIENKEEIKEEIRREYEKK